MTLDGKIATNLGHSAWVSSAQSRCVRVWGGRRGVCVLCVCVRKAQGNEVSNVCMYACMCVVWEGEKVSQGRCGAARFIMCTHATQGAGV